MYNVTRHMFLLTQINQYRQKKIKLFIIQIQTKKNLHLLLLTE